MSKSSRRHATSPGSQPRPAGRPTWLVVALIVLGGVALVSTSAWFMQRNAPVPAQDTPTQSAPFEAAVDGPRIRVDQDRFDYGDVKLNTTIETAVRVRNTGNQMLALDQNPVVELIEGC